MGVREMGERDRQANLIEQCLKYLQALVYFTVHEQVELDKFQDSFHFQTCENSHYELIHGKLLVSVQHGVERLYLFFRNSLFSCF